MKKECIHCNYEWRPRIAEPKSCPRCKRRFDYLNTPDIEKRGLVNLE